MQVLRNKGFFDWSSWQGRNLDYYKRFFIDEGFISGKPRALEEIYSEVHGAVESVKNMIYTELLPEMINETPGLRVFLLLHSVFNINFRSVDALEMFMRKELSKVTLEEMQSYCSGNRLSPDIMNRYSGFEPVSASAADMYPIRITYKLYQDRDKSAPIDLDLLSWPRLERMRRGISSEDMISKQIVIICGAA